MLFLSILVKMIYIFNSGILIYTIKEEDMLNETLSKIVVLGWNNFTMSLVEGLRVVYPNMIILCPDITEEEYKLGEQAGYLNPLPYQNNLIYEDTDFVIIDKNGQELLNTLQKIKPFLQEKTYIMDFQSIKSPLYNNNQDFLGLANPYISAYIFLDEYPSGITIRSSIFRDKIVALVSNGAIEVLKDCKIFWDSLHARLVPTTAEFFDEIYAMTNQSIELFASMYAMILQRDSWADTLFFGFYNKMLRYFMMPIENGIYQSAKGIIQNADNIRRILNFIKREINQLDQFIDDENIEALTKYLTHAKNFKDRI